MGLLFSAYVGVLGLVIIVSIVSIYFYNRGLAKEIEERSKQRESLTGQIAELRNKVPRELEFLSDGPSFVEMFCSSDEGVKEQQL